MPFRIFESGSPLNRPEPQRLCPKRRSSPLQPMGKVPALVLDNGEVLIDSAGIIDVLHEMAGPNKALIPPSGAARLRALQLIGIGLNIYPKPTALYDESLRPHSHQLQSAFEGLAEQA